MNNQARWERSILRWGMVCIALAIIFPIVILILTSLVRGMVIPGGIVPGVSVMLFLMGAAALAQYTFIRRNPHAGKQMLVREQDERLVQIRDRAGHQAFRVSSALGFLALLWAAFAGEAGLPALSGETLFFLLLVVVGVPMLIYAIISTREQNAH